MSTLTLKRTFGSLLGGLVSSGGLVALSLFFYLTTPDRPWLERILVSSFFLVFGVLALVSSVYLMRPSVVEADDEGVRRYQGGRLLSDIRWNQVAWVAYGYWSVDVAFLLLRKTALCLLVRGPHVRKSIGMDDALYQLTKEDITRFAQRVVGIAQSRSVEVLSKPRF